MPKLIEGADCLEAWRKVAALLLATPGQEINDVIVSIENPVLWSSTWFTRIDPKAIDPAKGERPSNVANTIFPAKAHRNAHSRADLYARYKRAHRTSRNQKWGTYFLRLIDFGAKHVNQLENAIHTITSWEMTPRNAICLHTSSPELDSIRLRGGPCLQAIQLHVTQDAVGFTAFYRNHDYFNKALPNFVGLGRLQNFIATETGLGVGPLVCCSTHAYANTTKAKMRSLLAR